MKSTSFIARLRRVTWRLSPAIRRHRRYLVTGTLGTLLVVACRLAYPWPLRGFLEVAFNEHKQRSIVGLVPSWGDPVVVLVGLFLIIVLLQGIGELIQKVSFARFSIGLVRDVRTEALAGVKRRPASEEEVGDLIARVIGDTARFKSGLKGILIRMTQSGTFFIGVCVMLFLMEPLLGLVFLAGGALVLTVAGLGASRVNRVARRLRKKEGVLAARMHAALAGGLEDMVELDTGEKQAGQVEAKTTKMEGVTTLAVHAILGVTICGVLALGVHDVRTGKLQPADLFTVLFYLLQVHNPTVRLGRQAMRLGRVLASGERLVKLMNRRPPEVAPRAPDDLFAAWAQS